MLFEVYRQYNHGAGAQKGQTKRQNIISAADQHRPYHMV
jgi:hypothetical protein